MKFAVCMGVRMKTILELIEEQLKAAFADAGYEEAYGRATVSNRPDLCEFQCNGAMAAAKAYKKAPIAIAEAVVLKLSENRMFSDVVAVNPGFINLSLEKEYLASYVDEMSKASDFGCRKVEKPETVIVDFGGANAAKPLHVGHLRSAVIGESVSASKDLLEIM